MMDLSKKHNVPVHDMCSYRVEDAVTLVFFVVINGFFVAVLDITTEEKLFRAVGNAVFF